MVCQRVSTNKVRHHLRKKGEKLIPSPCRPRKNFSESSGRMLIFYVSLWQLLFQGSLALRIIGVVVPSEVAAGRDALLQCHYDLEGSSLYALKWYKGSHEFYRFILKEVPPVQTFPWSSITIHHEETRSRLFAAPLAGRVLLRNVTSAAEGVYKCEVSTEAPYFDTDYEEANLSVIEVTSENPIISWLQGRLDWEYDDVFHFKCSMNGTRPASQLSWLLNGQPVPSAMVEPYDPVLIKSDSALSSSSSSSSSSTGLARYYSAQLGLRFKMQPHLFLSSHSTSSSSTSDQLELTCVSRVGLRKGSDVVIEGRAKWIVRHPAGGGIRQRQAAQQTVDKWQEKDDDYDDDQGGGGGAIRRKGKNQEPDENDDEEEVEEDDDVVTRLGSSSSSDSDGTAQSISDSENPSRRTQPVVGSHPGRVNNKSSPINNSSNKTTGGPALVGLHVFFISSAAGSLMILISRSFAVGF